MTRGAKAWRAPKGGRRGPPRRAALALLEVGQTCTFPVPTSADVKRVAKNVSQYGMRHGRGFRCATDRATRIMTVIRLR